MRNETHLHFAIMKCLHKTIYYREVYNFLSLKNIETCRLTEHFVLKLNASQRIK